MEEEEEEDDDDELSTQAHLYICIQLLVCFPFSLLHIYIAQGRATWCSAYRSRLSSK